MKTFYYHVTPSTYDGPWREGDTNVILPSGHAITRVRQADPPADFYDAIVDTRSPPPYTRPGEIALSFTGAIQGDSGRVVEDARANDVALTLDELRSAKYDELDDWHSTVAQSPFQHDAGPVELWVPQGIAQTSRDVYNGYLATRGLDILFDAIQVGIDANAGTSNELSAFWTAIKTSQESVNDQYWSRDIKVFLWTRDDPPQRVVDTATQNQWKDLVESAATFEWQHRNARDRVTVDIETEYGAGHWDNLAAIDVSAESYNWPPFFPGDLRG